MYACIIVYHSSYFIDYYIYVFIYICSVSLDAVYPHYVNYLRTWVKKPTLAILTLYHS